MFVEAKEISKINSIYKIQKILPLSFFSITKKQVDRIENTAQND